MLNDVILIGRLTHEPQMKTLDDGRKVCDINLAVRRSFKNINGEYDTDFIKVTLWEGLADIVCKYTFKGCLLTVKGRLQTRRYEISEEKAINICEVIGERVTYLSKPQTKNDEEIY